MQESSVGSNIWLGTTCITLSHGINLVDPERLVSLEPDYKGAAFIASGRMHLTPEMVGRIIVGMKYILNGVSNTIVKFEQPLGTDFINSPTSIDFYDHDGVHCRFGSTGKGCVLGIVYPHISYISDDSGWNMISYKQLTSRNIRAEAMMHLSHSRIEALLPALEHFVSIGGKTNNGNYIHKPISRISVEQLCPT